MNSGLNVATPTTAPFADPVPRASRATDDSANETLALKIHVIQVIGYLVCDKFYLVF